jgi:hypothetical protein
MLNRKLLACAVVGCLGLAPSALRAQSVVHALTGTVSAIDPAQKTITVFLDSGSEGTFKDMTNAKAPISFDKRVLADATSVDAFKRKGAYVIIFYFGGRDTRTAVALRSLGAGPFTATDGTVTQFDNHDRSISVEDKAGAIATYKINTETVAESTYGAIDGLKFQTQKGDHVRVVGTSENGAAVALFISAM